MDEESGSAVGAALRPQEVPVGRSRPQDGQPHTVAPTTAHKRKRLMAVAGLLLIASTIGVVRYWPSPTPNSQLLTPNTQPPPLPNTPSLVVLPFINMSEDPKQDYFSDGITEDLTTALSQIASLFVIDRNSAFTYKGKAVKVQEVGKELGVQYVLEGSVRRASDQVRITAQLIDATTGYHLWSERYDRPLKDIFALQDEIVQKIVTTLKLQLTLREQGYLVHKTTNNLEAYDAYLRGIEFYNRATQETNIQARQLFEKAITLDPQYAEAYAKLSWTRGQEWVYQWVQDPKTLEQQLVLAQKAVTLDNSLPGAYTALCYAYLYNRQHEQAMAAAERIIALAPSDAEGFGRLGSVLNFAGRPEEAIGLLKKAMRLNPRYPYNYLSLLGMAYGLTGQYEEAITTLKAGPSRPVKLSSGLQRSNRMSVTTPSASVLNEQSVAVPTDVIWRLSVDQYHAMIQADILTEDDPVELLEGWLVTKISKNPNHRVVTQLIREAIAQILPSGWYVDAQEPVTTKDSEPEPDVAVVRGHRRQYIDRHPSPQDIALVVEVADSSLRRDRTLKKRIYAAAGIAIYWIVNLLDNQIEVYSEPSGPNEQPDYRQQQNYGR